VSTYASAKDRKPRTCIGEMHPGAMYTIERVNEALGIGRDSLVEGIRAGVIARYFYNKRVYVEGVDVIAWIKRQAKK
jgi:hypothetical protein